MEISNAIICNSLQCKNGIKLNANVIIARGSRWLNKFPRVYKCMAWQRHDSWHCQRAKSWYVLVCVCIGEHNISSMKKQTLWVFCIRYFIQWNIECCIYGFITANKIEGARKSEQEWKSERERKGKRRRTKFNIVVKNAHFGGIRWLSSLDYLQSFRSVNINWRNGASKIKTISASHTNTHIHFFSG